MVAQSQFITDLLKSLKSKYQQLIDDAMAFYLEYDEIHGLYARENNRIHEIDQQLATIEAYKEKHGVYPQIKDHETAESYIEELNRLKDRADIDIRRVEPEVFKGFERRNEMLHSMSRSIAQMMITNKDASQFVATMMLRAPLPADHTRCPNNEKSKPVYIAALACCLLKRLVKQNKLDNKYIVTRFPKKIEQEHGLEEYNKEEVDLYITEVLQPIVTACLIHNIGSYSIDAERIYKGSRYKVLEEEDRKRLIKVVHDNTMNYLHYGIGKPSSARMFNPTEYQVAADKFEMMENVIKGYSKADDLLGNLLRVPMIYSSFILSTKQQHDFRITFKAFDILKSGLDKHVIHPLLGKEFLKMVGHYPLGTGIFFISKETNLPERAVVTGLNPPATTSAIVKQLTRRQVKFDDHTQVCVSKDYIISNEAARKASDFGPDYYEKQFPKGYFWNPAEPWERDIDHKKFWRRDNSIKKN